MRDFFNKVKSFAKNHPVILGVLAVVLAAPVAVKAWGPNRELFTMEKPATYVTFNSITNNPVIGGDERNFVGIREKGTKNAWSDSVKVEAGKEYYIRMYVHNNAQANLNLVAENVVAKMNIPTAASKSITVDGLISSSNAKPNQVWDNATFTSDEEFSLSYVAGSALYENNGFKGGVALPDSLVTNSGAKLGYDKLDGKIPGCMQYAGYVTVLVKPNFKNKPSISLQKTVRKSGEKTWNETVSANAGEEVEFQIHAKNTGTSTIENLVIRDILPKGLDYVAGSAKLLNAANPKGLAIGDDVIKDSGVNVGAYRANGDAYVRLKAKVTSNENLPACGNNTLTNLAQASNQKIVQNDTASVIVKKTCDEPKPAMTCGGLTINKISRTKFEFNTNYTVKNTEFKGVKYIIKDANGKIIAEKIVENGSKLTFESQATGKFTVTSIIMTSKGEASDKSCEKEFTIEEEKQIVTVCNSVTIVKISRTKFEINVNYTVTNTTFVGVKYVIKNEFNQTIIEKTENSGKFTIEINKTGKYTIVVYIINKDGTISTKTCEKEIIVEKEQTPSKPEISITKTVNKEKFQTVEAGKDFNYEITVKNTGNVALKNAKITDNAPANVKFINADNGQIVNGNYSYTIPELKVGESFTVNIKAQATATGMKAKNTACVNAENIPGENDGCDSADIEVPAPNKPPVTPNEPAQPIKPNQPKNPNLPSELPQTGADMLTAFVGVGSVVLAFGYYIASRKQLS